MGWAFVIGQCFGCGRTFTFNHVHVPSVPAAASGTGTREPVCRACVEKANPVRIENGLPPIVIHPDAYEPEEVV
jgi:hypothetical protein